MRYYFLQADNTPGGPEPLGSLVSMTASGQITLATLVVPEGGEDWTPLARVLSFHYADAQGQPAGPVPFSELSRMQQVQALTVESWVLPVGATQWVSLKDVLTAGGAAIAQAVTPVRQVTAGPGQPGRGRAPATRPAGGQNPYAAPKTQVRTVVVRRPVTGGIGRLKYFLFGLGLAVILAIIAVIYVLLIAKGNVRSLMSPYELLVHMATLTLVLAVIGHVCGFVLTFSRTKSIGWPPLLTIITVLPLALQILYSFAKLRHPSLYGVFVGVSLLSMIYYALMLCLPPGYARTKKLDTPAVILLVLHVLLLGGMIVGTIRSWNQMNAAFSLAAGEDEWNLDPDLTTQDKPEEPSAPTTLDEIRQAAEEAARRKPAGSNP